MPETAFTPGQTIGPFFHCVFPYPGDSRLVDDAHPGAIRLHGTVYDGVGHPVPDALVELWQADPNGNIVQRTGSLRRDGSTFTGWGRSATDVAGHYSFTTLAPASVTAGRPAFFAITVFARGLLNRLFTRAYLPDGNLDTDPLLANLSAVRRNTLVCVHENGSGRMTYRFDIHLQGGTAHPETVFLTFRGEQ
jgi:protocatechuate 3,4-dioxygenase, alpha subunit